MNRKLLKIFLLLVIFPLAVGGCTWPWQKKTPVPTMEADWTEPKEENNGADFMSGGSRLEKFANHGELALWLADNSNPRQISADQLQELGSGLFNNTAASFFDYQALNPAGVGVNEADIAQTADGYVYALIKEELFVIKADSRSGDAMILSKIAFKSRPRALLLYEDNLVVFGRDQYAYEQPLYQGFLRQGPYTFVKIFDVSDPSNPRPSRDLNFEGVYREARLVDGQVYFLTETQLPYISSEPLLPRLIDNGRVLPQQCVGAQRCFSPAVYYLDGAYENYRFLNISQIDLSRPDHSLSGQVYILDPQDYVYFSQQNIYLLVSRSLSEQDQDYLSKKEVLWPRLSAADQAKITEIEAAPSHLLNNHEKRLKALQILDPWLSGLSADLKAELQAEIAKQQTDQASGAAAGSAKTWIHKIAASSTGLEQQAKGEVAGRLINPWSIHEQGDNLRLVTTRQPGRLNLGSAAAYNNVYVLDGELNIIGRLENLATTEPVAAVRFFAGRAYIATTNPADPLFIIDLSDEKKPQVLNAVKVPGTNNYLHPVDDNGYRLLGLGRAEAAGEGLGVGSLKLSLYDFSDPARPKEEDSYIIQEQGGHSIALSDHRSLLYSASGQLVALPTALSADGRLNFSGVLLFSLDNTGLNFTGRIDHSDGGRFTQADTWQGINYYNNTVKRSWLANGRLFTLSNKFLKINQGSDWSEVDSLTLIPTQVEDAVNSSAGSVPPATSDEESGPNNEEGEGALPPAGNNVDPESGMGDNDGSNGTEADANSTNEPVDNPGEPPTPTET